MKYSVVRKALAAPALGVVLGMSMVPAQAGWLDNLFSTKPDLNAPGARSWRIDQFSGVTLAARESSAAPNQHPATVSADALAGQLAAIEVRVRGSWEPLFDPDELKGLAPVLVRALAGAGPNDDVLLLSTARRGGTFAAPKAVTARVFFEGGALNLIVRDARNDFMETYNRTRREPRFEFGSRQAAGRESARVPSGSGPREDWIRIPLASLSAGAAPAASPTAAVQPPKAATPAATLPVAPVATPAAPPPVPGSPAAIADEVEQRLVTLKRLRERGLITEEEYQQKRREVLQKL